MDPFPVVSLIRHLHISRNTPCLPPKFCISIVFNFLGTTVTDPEEMKNEVYYGRCVNGKFFDTEEHHRLLLLLLVLVLVLLLLPPRNPTSFKNEDS